jgi:hypothetical protein
MDRQYPLFDLTAGDDPHELEGYERIYTAATAV